MTQAIITPQEHQQAAPSPIQIAPETIAKFTQDATSRQYGKVTESDLVGNRPGILATARDRNGMVSQEITGESVIEFRGIAMSVDRAVKVGILRPNGQGGYEEVSQMDRMAHEAQAESERQQDIAERMAPETDLATIDREAPQMLADLIQGAETHGYQVEQITTELLCKPDVFHRQTLPSIAKKLGMTVEQVATQVNRIPSGRERFFFLASSRTAISNAAVGAYCLPSTWAIIPSISAATFVPTFFAGFRPASQSRPNSVMTYEMFCIRYSNALAVRPNLPARSA